MTDQPAQPDMEMQLRIKALDLAVFSLRDGFLRSSTSTVVLDCAERYLAWMKGEGPRPDLRVKDGGSPIRDGEPTFTLRGKDRFARAAIEAYIDALDEGGLVGDFVDDVKRVQKRFEDYPKVDANRMCDPD